MLLPLEERSSVVLCVVLKVRSIVGLQVVMSFLLVYLDVQWLFSSSFVPLSLHLNHFHLHHLLPFRISYYEDLWWDFLASQFCEEELFSLCTCKRVEEEGASAGGDVIDPCTSSSYTSSIMTTSSSFEED